MEEAVVMVAGSVAVATVGALLMAAILVSLSGMASRLTKERSLRRTVRMEVTTGPEELIHTEILIGMTIHTTAITPMMTAIIPIR
jgi:hypothetical protein